MCSCHQGHRPKLDTWDRECAGKEEHVYHLAGVGGRERVPQSRSKTLHVFFSRDISYTFSNPDVTSRDRIWVLFQELSALPFVLLLFSSVEIVRPVDGEDLGIMSVCRMGPLVTWPISLFVVSQRCCQQIRKGGILFVTISLSSFESVSLFFPLHLDAPYVFRGEMLEMSKVAFQSGSNVL